MEVKRRVLVVEDEEKIASSWCRGLESDGFSAETTPSNSGGESYLKANPCDLVILDLILSDGWGTRLLRFMDATNSPIPVIVVSGHLNKDIRTDFAVAGIRVLEKPCKLLDLTTMAKNTFVGNPDCRLQFGRTYGLSKKEDDAFLLGLEGKTTTEMAELLECSESTIYTYWKRIAEKTDCRDREAVIALFLRQIYKPLPGPLAGICDKIDEDIHRLYSI